MLAVVYPKAQNIYFLLTIVLVLAPRKMEQAIYGSLSTHRRLTALTFAINPNALFLGAFFIIDL